ncbi:MAG TPA: nascent polypeptide-associated complex protein [Candidatus Paceibacterota bacterium]|nr:nascent polypeptide-associated complex protein [Candidatus Paceibacterota bacterium]
MIPGINPSQMKAVMKQMGIKQEDIDAIRVIIEKEDENIVIDNPSVIKVVMQGQESFQITGESRVEAKEKGFSEEDVKMVMEKTGASEEDAKDALEKTGDLAEAILELS